MYQGSSLSLNEFCVLYSWISSKAKLNTKSKELILKFIKRVCPADNVVPNSIYRINTNLKVKKAKVQKICQTCSSLITDDNVCNNEECKSFNNCKPTEIIKYNVASQLSYVIDKQLQHISNLNGRVLILFNCIELFDLIT